MNKTLFCSCLLVRPRRPSDKSDAMTLWLYMFLSIYISMYRRRVPTSFPQCLSRPPEISCLKRETTLLWPHWIFALIQWPPGNVQNKSSNPLPVVNFSPSFVYESLLQLASKVISNMGWFLEERGRRRFGHKDRVSLPKLSSTRPGSFQWRDQWDLNHAMHVGARCPWNT